jgi:nicotinamidase-related amidase
MNSAASPRTLREIAGLPVAPSSLADSVLIIVDAQKEYTEGALPLPGVHVAIGQIARLLSRARAAHTPVIHVVQHGRRGGKICDPDGPFVAIFNELRPVAGEIVVVKSLPSSFKVTSLDAEIKRTGRRNLIIVGFMTHMCVNSTVRDGAEAGYACTVVANACGTRDLPDGQGGTLPAALVHAANLAALRDRFAVIVDNPDAIPS